MFEGELVGTTDQRIALKSSYTDQGYAFFWYDEPKLKAVSLILLRWFFIIGYVQNIYIRVYV